MLEFQKILAECAIRVDGTKATHTQKFMMLLKLEEKKQEEGLTLLTVVKLWKRSGLIDS